MTATLFNLRPPAPRRLTPYRAGLYRGMFLLAALYNTAFGLWAGFWPNSFFDLFGMPRGRMRPQQAGLTRAGPNQIRGQVLGDRCDIERLGGEMPFHRPQPKSPGPRLNERGGQTRWKVDLSRPGPGGSLAVDH